jgi:hypothetical protein
MTNMKRGAWGIDDPLFRGDGADGVGLPVPDAPTSLVRHVLYLEGAGRKTPYVSTTEDEETAERFAGKTGRVWHALVTRFQAAGLRYISNSELLGLLRGKGKGDAAWPKASEVQRARAYAEQWAEHLVDFRAQKGKSFEELNAVVRSVLTRERP